MGKAAATAHRRLLRSTHPHLRFLALTAATPGGPGWWLTLSIGDNSVLLQMPAHAWPDWHPMRTGADVPEALLAAGISQIGTPLWQALAQATCQPVQLMHARWLPEAPAAPADALAWRLQGSAWHGTLHLVSASAWQQWADVLPEPASMLQLPPGFGVASAAHEALCVLVALEIGRTLLPLADLARLRRHAVLLIDTPVLAAPQRGVTRAHAVRVLAGPARLCVAHALWQPSVLLRREAAAALSLQGITMNDTHANPSAATDAESLNAEALDLGAVEVQVRFELARQHWPLAHLAQWRVGEALSLETPLTDAVISAWVSERCVASGRLVTIGDKLGLRIDALNAEAARAAAAPPAASPPAPKPASKPAPAPAPGRSD